jgi:hypothetical protein
MSLFTQLRRRLANFAGYLPKGSLGEGKHGLGWLLQPLQARLMLTTPPSYDGLFELPLVERL